VAGVVTFFAAFTTFFVGAFGALEWLAAACGTVDDLGLIGRMCTREGTGTAEGLK
jgi:hypothetical protein